MSAPGTAKRFDPDTGEWVPVFVGARGISGLHKSDTPPDDTGVLWLDTEEVPDYPLPPGGEEGEVLTKASGAEDDVSWRRQQAEHVDVDDSELSELSGSDVQAVLRQLDDEVAYVHNVVRYGAIGDGETDDTQALQEAADAAAGGGILLVPAGTFVTDPISLTSDTTVWLVGTLKLRAQDLDEMPDEFGILQGVGTDTSWLENIHIVGFGGGIDGNKSNMTGSNDFGAEGIELEYVRNSSVQDLKIVDVVADGVDLDDCENVRVVGNTVRNCGGWGIHCSHGAEENLVAYNDVEDCGFDNNRGGIDQWGNNPGGHRNRFIGNVARDNYRNYGVAGSGAVFVGNHSFGSTTADDNLSGVAQGQPHGELAFGSNTDLITLTEDPQDIIVLSDVEVHGPGDRVVELAARAHIQHVSGSGTWFRGEYLVDGSSHDRWVSTDNPVNNTVGVGVPKRVILSPGTHEVKISVFVGDDSGTQRIRGDVQATELRVTDLGPA